jgi:hypothetical protein
MSSSVVLKLATDCCRSGRTAWQKGRVDERRAALLLGRKEKPVRDGRIDRESISKKRSVSCADSLVTPITTFAVPLGDLDPAGLWVCAKDGSPLLYAHPIPCSRRDNSAPQERLRRRASAKLC